MQMMKEGVTSLNCKNNNRIVGIRVGPTERIHTATPLMQESVLYRTSSRATTTKIIPSKQKMMR